MEKVIGQVPVGISNRHIHVTQSDLDVLFGKGHQLTVKKELSQPGQFAAEECVTIKGPKGSIEKVRILGPMRPETQIEISLTDSFKLGIQGVLRNSGDVAGTPGCEVIGPNGTLQCPQGVIVAARHLHLSPSEAAELGLKDKDIVSIRTQGPRAVVMSNVLVRSGEKHAKELHIDMDEANCAALKNGLMVEVLK